MAKRMFSTNIVESDSFLDMPLTSQSLYFHLCMNADNDGFVNPKRIMRMIGAANDDLQVLIVKKFLICWESGVVVIKHWWINNTKRSDRHVPTTYQFELAQLYLKSNKSYTQNTTEIAIPTEVDNQLQLAWQPNGSERLPQYNAIQDNTTQSNASASRSRDVNKLTKEQKRSYAKAVQADKVLTEKESNARNRSTNESGYASAKEVVEKIKQRSVK